jgi:hypothetical protein
VDQQLTHLNVTYIDDRRLVVKYGETTTVTIEGQVLPINRKDTDPRISILEINRLQIEGPNLNVDVEPKADVGTTFVDCASNAHAFPVELVGQGAVALIFPDNPENSFHPASHTSVEDFLRSL